MIIESLSSGLELTMNYDPFPRYVYLKEEDITPQIRSMLPLRSLQVSSFHCISFVRIPF